LLLFRAVKMFDPVQKDSAAVSKGIDQMKFPVSEYEE